MKKQKQSCGECLYWKQQGPHKKIGICIDAIERARKVVPLAIDMQVLMVYSGGVNECPCFERQPPANKQT